MGFYKRTQIRTWIIRYDKSRSITGERKSMGSFDSQVEINKQVFWLKWK